MGREALWERSKRPKPNWKKEIPSFLFVCFCGGEKRKIPFPVK